MLKNGHYKYLMKLHDLPAFAGTVQGVVVHIASHKLDRISSNELPKDGDALTNLNMAYILFETCPSGYCKRISVKKEEPT